MEEFKKKRSFGGHKPAGGEHKSFGGRKPFQRNSEGGERRSFGEHKSFGERRSFHSDSEEGGRRPFRSREDGEGRRSFRSHEGGEERHSSERRSSFGEHKSYGEHKPSFGDRKPSFGGRKPSFGGRRPFGAGRKKEDGIDRMISRKPLVSKMEAPKEVEVIAKDEVRLNKFIANSGVCSRREADTMIQAGVVSVNGEVVTELGTKVNIFNDEVRFNGELLRGESKVYIVMNKPKGFVTTASDPHADKTVMDLLKNCTARVFPVGRLDKNTTGVLMFTNDGDVAEKLAHPSYDKKKIYQVTLDRNLSQEDFDQILSGVELADGVIAADELEFVDEGNHKKLGIEIHSGKNRIVRRIFEHLGYDVKGLDRVYFAGLTKKGLKRGEWRYLTENEANILKMGAYI
ncbi:MAG: rRNA pseudouridine synthase [Bacteroidales bacterium]|nr:rRNA pseudouridine synthase [Bacteroidales bacterium]MBQ9186150.1 rRNA pseudouridine synthase [Bacteroidales bacterium]